MSPTHVEILTLFPSFFDTPLEASILGRAREAGLVDLTVTDIRDFATDRHRTTDDLPYGGGAGMVMKPEPLVAALEAARARHAEAPRILLTPQGDRFSQSRAEQLAELDAIILVCGHYEGVDERVRQGWIDREMSIGDYVLTGGEPAALVVTDAVVRLIPGVVGNPESLEDESFGTLALEYPQYTRPRVFREMEVPEVLLSGHHAKIAAWRRAKARERTRARRPDLLDDTE